MNGFSKQHYYEDFYFHLIQQQYYHQKLVTSAPEKCVFKDVGLPAEIVFGAGLLPTVIEIAVGMLPPETFTAEILARSERYFYDSGICSFNKFALPAIESGALSLPKAFVCIALCQDVARNFSLLAHKFARPYFAVDIPYGRSEEALQYVARQFADLGRALCELAGVPFDVDRFREVVRKSNAAMEHLRRANELRRRSPALFFGSQMLKFMNIRMFLGTDGAISVAKKYFEVCQERNDLHITPVNEKYRVLWCNLGMMYDGQFLEYMERELGTIIAFEEMSYVPEEPMDERQPFDALAKSLLTTPFIGSAKDRATSLIEQVESYQIDGVIVFAHVNCRMFNAKLRLIKDILDERGIPMLELSGDCIDKRNYSRAQLQTRLEAFVEMLAMK